MTTLAHPQALTKLGEEEGMFRDAVREFARSEVAPRVPRMEASGEIDSELISLFFELGFMGGRDP